MILQVSMNLFFMILLFIQIHLQKPINVFPQHSFGNINLFWVWFIFFRKIYALLSCAHNITFPAVTRNYIFNSSKLQKEATVHI